MTIRTVSQSFATHFSPAIKEPRLEKIALFCFTTDFDRKLGLLATIKKSTLICSLLMP